MFGLPSDPLQGEVCRPATLAAWTCWTCEVKLIPDETGEFLSAVELGEVLNIFCGFNAIALDECFSTDLIVFTGLFVEQSMID